MDFGSNYLRSWLWHNLNLYLIHGKCQESVNLSISRLSCFVKVCECYCSQKKMLLHSSAMDCVHVSFHVCWNKRGNVWHLHAEISALQWPCFSGLLSPCQSYSCRSPGRYTINTHTLLNTTHTTVRPMQCYWEYHHINCHFLCKMPFSCLGLCQWHWGYDWTYPQILTLKLIACTERQNIKLTLIVKMILVLLELLLLLVYTCIVFNMLILVATMATVYTVGSCLQSTCINIDIWLQKTTTERLW